MSHTFVHLRVHSEYSIANGIVRVKPLVKAAAATGMPAIAMTDQCNLFGMVKFYRAAQNVGVKPIIGVDLLILNDADPNKPHRLVVLCQNQVGYLNLTRLVSRAYMEGQHFGQPLVSREWFEGASDGLIALSGGRLGDIGQSLLSDNRDQAEVFLNQWLELFDDRFYIELQRTGRTDEETYLHQAVELALQRNVAVVATNDVHFLDKEDFDAHEARVCIHEGRTLDDSRRPRHFSDQQYFRTGAEMAELFADLPEALENTVEIARRCNLSLVLDKTVLPDFPIPENLSEVDYFSLQARNGLEQRLSLILAACNEDERDTLRQSYYDRLQLELDVIIKMGFTGYFLIVADFIRWAKEHDVPVGPGRGSGAGSLVAYSLDITDLDPICYELLFERFLNPERVSMPDFDIDFCMEKRDLVIDYVVQRYGRERVSQIITFGSMAAKAVVRDVGRVLSHPYGFVDKLAKLIPFELGMTLEKALESEERLRQRYDEEEDVKSLFDLARSLEGIKRNAGKHAGGVVIAPTALTDFSPLYCEQGASGTVTQFDKDDVEAVGLVKFDFLGLRTLTIIDWAVKTINRQRQAAGEERLDIAHISLVDPATFTLLKKCLTTAVFQLESRGMKDLIKRLQPDSFDEIIALVALFRPGPLQSGMVDDFINRKHGRTAVEYPHSELEPILKPTYGVILYQEQVMQIAQVLAGYTLGGADLLRRAMGKKKVEEMAEQRAIFTEGAVARGVAEKTATYIFDLMEKFAGYGFNKSHSAAYALLSYQTAWLKTHYPSAFMAAVLSADMDNTDKVVTLIDECRDIKLTVQPPDVNHSGTQFTVDDKGCIRYGLGALKGVGQAAVDSLVEEREQGGPFGDLFDFCKRVDSRKINRRMHEALVRAGALDHLGPNRATLMASITTAVQAAEQYRRDTKVGQVDLFGDVLEQPGGGASFVPVEEWSKEQRLLAEKETLGLYLTGHPITRYESELRHFISSRIVDLKPDRDQKIIIAGLIVGIRTMNSRRGDRMAFITLDDRTGRIELGVFPENYQRYRDMLVKDKLLVVEGTVSIDDYSGGFRMSGERMLTIDEARAMYVKKVIINLDHDQGANGFIGNLATLLAPYRQGSCPIWINYKTQHARVDVVLGQDWQIQLTDDLIMNLGKLVGPKRVRVIY